MSAVVEGLRGLRDRVIGPAWKEQAKNSFNSFKGVLGVLRGRAPPVPGTGAKYDELDEADGETLDTGEHAGSRRTYQPGLCSWCNRLPCSCPKRYLMACMCSVGFMISFGIRCNVDFAKAVLRHNTSHDPNETVHPNAPYGHHIEWTPRIASLVDSSFFWGYLVTQIPGGIIASKLPATWVFGGAIVSTSFLNLFIPTAVTVHYGLVVIIRVTQGLVEGATYPACHGIWRYWAPPLERSRLATIAFCGSYAGAVLGLFLSGVVSQNLGWPAAFYLYGSFGLLWFISWFLLAHETPASHPTISEEERVYIETAIGATQKKTPPIPWGKFFTSMPVYAIIVANFARSWSFYMLIMTNPKYFSDVFHENMGSSGALSAVPHLVMAIIVPLGGQLADHLRKGILSTTAVRKIFNCGGFGLEACFLLGVGYTRNPTTAMVCLTIAVGFSGFAISGYNVNHLDIAPVYASILMGLSNGVGTLSGMICPVVAEYLTRDRTVDSWEKVYLIASLVHFFGVVFYAVFASGEKQPWAEPPEEAEEWKPSPLPPEAKTDDYAYGSDAQLATGYDYGTTSLAASAISKLSTPLGAPEYATQTYYVQKDGSMSTSPPQQAPGSGGLSNGSVYDTNY